MADKYLKNVNGQLAEAAATVTGGNVAQAGDIVGLDANGKLDLTIIPDSIGRADNVYIPAYEALAAGDLVNIYVSGPLTQVRKADASLGRRAHGFVKTAVAAPMDPAVVYKSGTITGKTIAEANQGATHYLGLAGACSVTPPTTAGHISQEIGFALSLTELGFEPQQPITLA